MLPPHRPAPYDPSGSHVPRMRPQEIQPSITQDKIGQVVTALTSQEPSDNSRSARPETTGPNYNIRSPTSAEPLNGQTLEESGSGPGQMSMSSQMVAPSSGSRSVGRSRQVHQYDNMMFMDGQLR